MLLTVSAGTFKPRYLSSSTSTVMILSCVQHCNWNTVYWLFFSTQSYQGMILMLENEEHWQSAWFFLFEYWAEQSSTKLKDVKLNMLNMTSIVLTLFWNLIETNKQYDAETQWCHFLQ